eukprot:g41140.t1
MTPGYSLTGLFEITNIQSMFLHQVKSTSPFLATIDTTDCQLKVERVSKKIAHIDTDIKFLLRCKKAQKILKGLQITNSLKSTNNTDYAETLCCCTSHTLLTHLIHQLYSRRHNFEIEIESIFPVCTQDTVDQLRDSAKQTRQQNYITYTHTKKKKLEKLGITTSSNQASPGTMVETSTTTEKSINLSDYTV